MESIIIKNWGPEVAMDELNETTRDFEGVSKETLLSIIEDNKDTELGVKFGFPKIREVSDFLDNMPLTTYEDYRDYIERELAGEKNLITTYPIKYFMQSSGTTGTSKFIPMTEQGIRNYARYSYEYAYENIRRFYDKSLDQKDVLREGRILLINEIRYRRLNDRFKCGIVSSAMFEWLREKGQMDFSRYSSPAEVLFPTEEMDMNYMKLRFALEACDIVAIEGVYVHQILNLIYYMHNNWQLLVDDIEKGIISDGVQVSAGLKEKLSAGLKPNPERAAELRTEFEKGFDEPIVPRIWKNIKFIMGISGGAFNKYMEKLKGYIGRVPYHYFIYAASEGIYGPALQVDRPDNYILAPKLGYFEFIPVNALDDPVKDIKDSIIQSSDLSVGEKYELVYTGFSGFYRYRTGDVLEIVGYYNHAPIIKFCYRSKQTVNIAGEKMDMASIADVVEKFRQQYALSGSDFCVYMDTDVIPARYNVLIETDGEVSAPASEYNRTIDDMFKEINLDYEDCRGLGEIGPAVVNYLEMGTFEAYRQYLMDDGKEVGQFKPVRILDDRFKKDFFFAHVKR